MLKKSSIALIVPCYNEAESIPYFGSEILDFIKLFKNRRSEYDLSVIIVDNSSTDNSLELLRALQSQTDCLNLETCSIRGYGAALKHGFSKTSAEYLAFLDLDNTYPLTCLIDLLDMLKAQKLDMVYGARIHNSSKISAIRSLGNQFYVVLLKYLFKSELSDVCSGMRVFRNSLKNGVIDLKSNDLSFSIDFTLFALMSNWKISELPIPYRDRVGESKLSIIKDGWLFLLSVIGNYIKKMKNNV